MPVGSRYGSLVVIGELRSAYPSAFSPRRYVQVLVRCECDLVFWAYVNNLRQAKQTSCGCRTRFKRKTA